MKDNKDHLRALLAAYNEVTGFGLQFIPAREHVLRALDKLELTPEDVTRVMQELKRLTISDPKHYPESSLDFSNAIGHVERFESRAKRLRSRVLKLKAPSKAEMRAMGAPASIEATRAAAAKLRAFREGGLR